jgi:tetratricopeptide (TPR) repeat protein
MSRFKPAQILLKLRIGRAYASGRFNTVVSYSVDYLKAQSDDLGILWILANSHFRLGDLTEAEAACRSILTISQHHLNAACLLAKIYHEKGQYSDTYKSICDVLFNQANLAKSTGDQEIDDLLQDLESRKGFLKLVKSVRTRFADSDECDPSWIDWALRFKAWYEDEQKSRGN